MKIAVPVENGRLNSHFGGSRQFCLFDVDQNTNTILRSEILEAPEHKPGLFPVWLREQGAEVVIAGGIGQRALAIFAHYGIRVVAGTPNTSAEFMVTAYLMGNLVSPPVPCSHDHEHHAHGHEHRPGGTGAIEP